MNNKLQLICRHLVQENDAYINPSKMEYLVVYGTDSDPVSYTHLDVYKRQINKLSYHYDEEVIRARRGSQIKTIQAMTELLENYEN